MQAIPPKTGRATISISPELKTTIRSLKRGNETYDDVLKPLIYTAAVHEKGEGIGALFLDSVYIHDQLRKVKSPIPLKIVIDENKSIILVNNEYQLLVVCSRLDEGLEEARREFESLYSIYTRPDIPAAAPAAAFGKKHP
ncbi:MAG: hypothetical protein Q4Q04_06450 [Methanocorpusculum sp.]|nr:hypothetical protein [Methanocorpusculum sp.]